MTDHFNPEYRGIASEVSKVTNKLDKPRPFSPQKHLARGQIKRGEEYLEGSRTLYDLCRPLMKNNDEALVRDRINLARHEQENLHANGTTWLQRLQDSKEFKRVSKNAYLTAKRTSNRALDDTIIGPLYQTNSPADSEAPTATPEQSGGTYLPAGAPPVPPEEPDGPSPHEPHVMATSSMREWIQNTQMTTLPSGDADPGVPMVKIGERRPSIYDPRIASSQITTSSHKTSLEEILDTTATTMLSGGAGIERPVDNVSDAYSFMYDPSLTSSGTSIDSYKTERTVNSRKSRYNALPRHKYADHDHLMPPQGLAHLHIDDPETELVDEHAKSLSSPPSPQPVSPQPGLGLESRAGPSTQPLDGPSAAPPATEHVQRDSTPTPPAIPRQGATFSTASLPHEGHGKTGGTPGGESFNDKCVVYDFGLAAARLSEDDFYA